MVCLGKQFYDIISSCYSQNVVFFLISFEIIKYSRKVKAQHQYLRYLSIALQFSSRFVFRFRKGWTNSKTLK